MLTSPVTEEQTLGASLVGDGVHFGVRSRTAERISISIFVGENEAGRVETQPVGDGLFVADIRGLAPGARYGLRADGPYDPGNGLWFDPDKLLVDPYAVAIDRPYVYDPRLAAPRGLAGDTAPLMPKSIVTDLAAMQPLEPALFSPGGLIYEVNVRGLTMQHPDVPPAMRGTIAALAHPAVIAHLRKIGVAAVELMPVVAWIDERHLGPLGLHNAWGYNPVTFKALDPRLAPGGVAELRGAVAALHAAGIGVILDLVFNHTGESDTLGATLSLRGLDNPSYYRHGDGGNGVLVNDTGTGNTIACDRPEVVALVLDALRHFVLHAGVDGFRFDLAPVLGRGPDGFEPDSPLLQAIRTDPLIGSRVLIAEPWDIGENGYQLGNFKPPMLEWNDRFRDDVRRFWRGDAGMIGALATRLAGSSDIFRKDGETTTRSVNFLAAHDGFSLADLVAYEDKHNEANGEQNRDGHNDNLSWNNGAEGVTAQPSILTARHCDLRAMLSTLFASRGAIMLTAGDEFGRTQNGNNNAYAQGNATTWLDWENRDQALEAHVAAISAFRRQSGLNDSGLFLNGAPGEPDGLMDVQWLAETGQLLTEHDWQQPGRHRLIMLLAPPAGRLAIAVNGDRRAGVFNLPARDGFAWQIAAGTEHDVERRLENGAVLTAGRSVVYFRELPSHDAGPQP